MTILAIDWGYALLVTGMGIGTVFLLLIVLIWVIGLQTKIINGITGHSKGASEEATVRTTETHPTPHEQAAIAMAMHLYFDAHDEEPHVITIQDVTVNLTDHHKANVEVNGISYDVSYESKNTVAAPIRKSTAPGTPQVHVSAPAAAASSATSIKAPLPGTIMTINVKVGDQVKRGDTLVVMEAMKMENNIMANKDGQVKAIHVTVGQTVVQDDKLVDLQ